MSVEPVISVVIPCFNGAETLALQLGALVSQSAPPGGFEVVVADNGSTDRSAAIARQFDSHAVRVRVVDASERRGINAARNAGAKAAVGKYLLFCDVDDVVGDAWVAAYYRAFLDGARIVGGPVRRWYPGDAAHGYPETARFENDLGFRPWPHGANCGVAAAVYDAIGPFDERFLGGGDETEFFWRAQLAGHELAYVPAAWITYTQREGLRATFEQNRAYGRSHVKLFRVFASSGMPRSSCAHGILWWLSVPIRFALAVAVPRRRTAFVKDLGVRTGRLSQSRALRTVFL